MKAMRRFQTASAEWEEFCDFGQYYAYTDHESDESELDEEMYLREEAEKSKTPLCESPTDATAEPDTLPLYVLIAVSGAIMGVISSANTYAIGKAYKLRLLLLQFCLPDTDATLPHVAAGLLSWVCFEAGLVVLAHLISRQYPAVFGSGIPEVRLELQGTHLHNFYGRRALFCKGMGLIVAEVAGLPIGKEGPFVHMSAIVSLLLLRLRVFAPSRLIPGYLRHVLLASAACATCSTFGVAIGSVLFALEVMPDIQWDNTAYWACILAAVTSTLMLKVLESVWTGESVSLLPVVSKMQNAPASTTASFDWWKYLVQCIILGALCGLLGALFVRSQIKLGSVVKNIISPPVTNPPRLKPVSENVRHTMEDAGGSSISDIRNKFKSGKFFKRSLTMPIFKDMTTIWKWRSIVLCLVVASLDAVTTFFVPIFRGVSQYDLLWKLVSLDLNRTGPLEGRNTEIPVLPTDSSWALLSEGQIFFLCLVLKWLLSSLSLALPLPSGCIVPLYVVGSLVGRCFSCISVSLFPQWCWASQAADFALVGATAFTACICRSFSVVVVVMELVSFHNEVLPMSAAAITAIYVANQFSPSIFEATIAAKRFPAIPQARTLLDGSEPVTAVMDRDVPTLPRVCTAHVLRQQLNRYPSARVFIIVAGEAMDMESSGIVGLVTRSDAGALLEKFHEENPRPAGVTFGPDVLRAAPQVPSWMSMKAALQVLELYASSAVFVVKFGRVIGMLNFEQFVEQRHHTRKSPVAIAFET